MLKWIIENWVSVLALFVAMVGGVPGIIAIYQHYTYRPNVVLSLKRLDYSRLNWPQNSEAFSYILLEVDVSNGENSPIALPPAPFLMSIKLNGKWKPFRKEVIPLSGSVLYATREDNTGANIDHRDLQKYRELNVGRLHGHYDATYSKKEKYQDSTHFLLYLSDQISLKELEDVFRNFNRDSLPIKIRWLDTKAKKNLSFLVAHRKPQITKNCYRVFPDRVKFFEFKSG